MTVSKFYEYINPVLAVLKSLGGSARPSEVCAAIARDLALPDSVLEERLKNGVSRFENQVHWTRFYLSKAGYIDSSRHGVWALTEKGRSVSSFSPGELRELIQEVQALNAKAPATSIAEIIEPEPFIEVTDEAPVPGLGEGNYREQLLALLKALPPDGFERLCQRLLREAGFEQVVVTGRAGDGGIDGHGILPLWSWDSPT